MTVEELRGCPLFRDIAPEDLQAMLGCLSAREAAPRRGDFILRTPDAHPLLGASGDDGIRTHAFCLYYIGKKRKCPLKFVRIGIFLPGISRRFVDEAQKAERRVRLYKFLWPW